MVEAGHTQWGNVQNTTYPDARDRHILGQIGNYEKIPFCSMTGNFGILFNWGIFFNSS